MWDVTIWVWFRHRDMLQIPSASQHQATIVASQYPTLSLCEFFASLPAAEHSKKFRLAERCIIVKLGAFMWLAGYTLPCDVLQPLVKFIDCDLNISAFWL